MAERLLRKEMEGTEEGKKDNGKRNKNKKKDKRGVMAPFSPLV